MPNSTYEDKQQHGNLNNFFRSFGTYFLTGFATIATVFSYTGSKIFAVLNFLKENDLNGFAERLLIGLLTFVCETSAIVLTRGTSTCRELKKRIYTSYQDEFLCKNSKSIAPKHQTPKTVKVIMPVIAFLGVTNAVLPNILLSYLGVRTLLNAVDINDEKSINTVSIIVIAANIVTYMSFSMKRSLQSSKAMLNTIFSGEKAKSKPSLAITLLTSMPYAISVAGLSYFNLSGAMAEAPYLKEWSKQLQINIAAALAANFVFNAYTSRIPQVYNGLIKRFVECQDDIIEHKTSINQTISECTVGAIGIIHLMLFAMAYYLGCSNLFGQAGMEKNSSVVRVFSIITSLSALIVEKSFTVDAMLNEIDRMFFAKECLAQKWHIKNDCMPKLSKSCLGLFKPANSERKPLLVKNSDKGDIQIGCVT
jgi:hypothetical protein